MKNVWLLAAIVLVVIGCGDSTPTYVKTGTTYGSGYFYGLEPFRPSSSSSGLLYAIRDTVTNTEITVVDPRSTSRGTFEKMKDIYKKETPSSWQQRPVLIHYQKVHGRWWAGTAADSTKSDVHSSTEYQITGISYVPLAAK